MDKELFAELLKSTSQAVEIVRGDRKPSRTFEVSSDIVRELIRETQLREQSGFSDRGAEKIWEAARRSWRTTDE